MPGLATKKIGQTKAGTAKPPGAKPWRKLDKKPPMSSKARGLVSRIKRAEAELVAEKKLAEETEKEFSALKRTLVLLPRPRPALGSKPGRMRGGEMYYGRQWCDMTRALDEQGLSSVDRNKDAVKDGVVEWHGRSYSDMSRQVAIYENDVQSPPMQVPPKTGRGFFKAHTDVTRDTEAIMWALRNRYPEPGAGAGKK